MIFLNSASSAAALVFYLPMVCVHTLTPKKTEKGKSPEYFKIFEKNTIFNEHPVAPSNDKTKALKKGPFHCSIKKCLFSCMQKDFENVLSK